MGKREEILAFIARLDEEAETAKVYGKDWIWRDWKTRQSTKGGELCLTVGSLTKAEAKARRRPGSIGARKARKRAKAYRREIKRLEAILAEHYSDYKATKPQYITTPGAGYDQSPGRKNIIRKNCETTPGGYVN